MLGGDILERARIEISIHSRGELARGGASIHHCDIYSARVIADGRARKKDRGGASGAHYFAAGGASFSQ
ncbi:MAG: hypothetical protein M0R66_00330 [Candidatus Omnitrophica bacterium]|nr:hypothetical protein [Candidatus Omnitrophota bacterium]